MKKVWIPLAVFLVVGERFLDPGAMVAAITFSRRHNATVVPLAALVQRKTTPPSMSNPSSAGCSAPR